MQASARGAGAAAPSSKSKAHERPGLTEEEIEEIRDAFQLFDTDGSGAFWPLATHPQNTVAIVHAHGTAGEERRMQQQRRRGEDQRPCQRHFRIAPHHPNH